MTVTWIMMTIIAMMIMIAATVVTAILIVTISLISNYQPNYINDSINSSTEQQQQEPTYLKTSDLNGVWSVSGSNGIYFIAFTETGHYSLCFNDKLMGAGTYSLDKNTLTLNNGYLYTKDNLKIEQTDKGLTLSGEMFDFKSIINNLLI